MRTALDAGRDHLAAQPDHTVFWNHVGLDDDGAEVWRVSCDDCEWTEDVGAPDDPPHGIMGMGDG